MRKSLAVLAVLGAFSVAGAHDFWLAGQNDDKLRVRSDLEMDLPRASRLISREKIILKSP